MCNECSLPYARIPLVALDNYLPFKTVGLTKTKVSRVPMVSRVSRVSRLASLVELVVCMAAACIIATYVQHEQ